MSETEMGVSIPLSHLREGQLVESYVDYNDKAVSIPLSHLREGQLTGFTQLFTPALPETFFLIMHLFNNINKFIVHPLFF